MGWRDELDALVQETMSLAEKATEPGPAPTPSVPLTLIEETFSEATPPAPLRPLNLDVSERELAKSRIASFRKHQERVQREREKYYVQTMSRARRLADGFSDEVVDR
jgi:hypothetical protein